MFRVWKLKIIKEGTSQKLGEFGTFGFISVCGIAIQGVKKSSV